jgi:ribosomal-protein-alanine N-acetyltransferase
MNAILKPVEARFEPLTEGRLPILVTVERRAYAYPWAPQNFVDAMAAGNQAQLLLAGETLLGYFVAMKGVDEVHLLNLTVAPEFQGQGWARLMLDALAVWARGQGTTCLWLEVRAGNERATRVYQAHGYRRVGLRKAYYPNGELPPEDAVVMSLKL